MSKAAKCLIIASAFLAFHGVAWAQDRDVGKTDGLPDHLRRVPWH